MTDPLDGARAHLDLMRGEADFRQASAAPPEQPAAGGSRHRQPGPSAPAGLRFQWSDELIAATPEEVDWIWRGLIARTSLTLIHSKPKLGKSTLETGLASALVDPDTTTFLGREVTTCGVLIASEEGSSTLAPKLPKGVRVLSRDGAFPKPSWDELIDACVTEAHETDCGLLVVDTFRFWGGLRGDQEKDSGSIQPLMDKLAEAATTGLGVLLVHHSRKSGGEDGDAASGSNAIVGAVDIELEMEKSPDHKANQRSIVGVGRYLETPGALVFEWDKETSKYEVIGESEDRLGGRAAALAGRILDALPSTGEGLTRADIEEEVGVAWKQLLPAIKSLTSAGSIEKSGAGKAGDPHRYRSVQHRHAQTGTDPRVNVCAPYTYGTDTHTPKSVRGTDAQTVAASEEEEALAERLLGEFGGDPGGAQSHAHSNAPDAGRSSAGGRP